MVAQRLFVFICIGLGKALEHFTGIVNCLEDLLVNAFVHCRIGSFAGVLVACGLVMICFRAAGTANVEGMLFALRMGTPKFTSVLLLFSSSSFRDLNSFSASRRSEALKERTFESRFPYCCLIVPRIESASPLMRCASP